MDMRNVGGTPGGTRTFLLGLVMLLAGGYLLFDHVQEHRQDARVLLMRRIAFSLVPLWGRR